MTSNEPVNSSTSLAMIEVHKGCFISPVCKDPYTVGLYWFQVQIQKHIYVKSISKVGGSRQ